MSDQSRRNREEWQSLIEQQAQSGLGVAEFCREHGLNREYFYRKRRQEYFYRKRRQMRDAKTLVPAASCFVQVVPAPLAEPAGSNFELQYRDSRLQMPTSTDPVWLAQLLQSL